MLNRVILIGRIVRDLELRKSTNGFPFVAFTVAAESGFGDKKTTAFVPCFAWNKTAENMVKYLHKGSLISVEGRLNTRTNVINGQKISEMSVNVDSVQFLDGRSGSNAGTSINSDYNNTTGVDFDNSFAPNPTPATNKQPAKPTGEGSPNDGGVSFDGDDAILWD